MERNIQDSLIPIIKNAIALLDFKDVTEKDILLDFTKDSRFGDLTTNIALKLSTSVKKAPLELAASIVRGIKKYLEKAPIEHDIEEVKVENAGFINFYLRNSY